MKAAALLLAIPLAAAPELQVPADHVVVYQEKGRFGGWPANHGIWSWGNEIVVGFRSAVFKVMPQSHAVDRDHPEEEYQARSLDGGRTWRVEKPPELKRPENHGPQPADCPGGFDFTNPDFALMLRSSGNRASRFYISTDRAKTWKGPYKLPLFGQSRIMARTDYLVFGRHELMLFLTAAKRNDQEGRVFGARTQDGGKTWEFLSWLGPEPAGFAIMPSSVRLGPGEILTAIRR